MTLPMWLIVIMVLFSALGVWALILFIGFMFRMIDTVLSAQKKQKNDGNPSV